MTLKIEGKADRYLLYRVSLSGGNSGYLTGREHCRLRTIIIHSKYFPYSETQVQSVGPGEKARQKFSSTQMLENFRRAF